MHKTFLLFLAVLFIVLPGCSRKKQLPPPVIPAVTGEKVSLHSYIPASTVIAAVKAFDEVNLVARVEGFLQKRHFVEGSNVKKGQLLFEIEPEIYKAKLKSAEAALSKALAARTNAADDFKRQEQLKSTNATSERTYERIKAAKLEADSEVKSAEAEVALARQNLSYTRIYAPFDGRIGISNYSEGNLVNSSSGVLATIVKNDPVRVEFSVSELQLMNMMRSAAGKKDDFRFQLITPDGRLYPFDGKVLFWDNKVNSSTGTFLLQAQFPNRDRLLVPGMFGRVRISVNKPLKGIMIPEEAIMIDQAGEYVYVTAPDGTVSRRNIKSGYRENGRAVIVSGLKAGETVITSGIQKARPGSKVKISFSHKGANKK